MRIAEQFQISKEFENYLQYWIQHMFRKDQGGIFPEMSIFRMNRQTWVPCIWPGLYTGPV